MLTTILTDGPVRLVPFTDDHVEGLRAACAADPDIWEIYPLSMMGEHFAPSLQFIRAMPGWTTFAVLDGEEIVGMTSYIAVAPPDAVEIGATYIAPHVRGGPFNRAMKRLLIDHAFANGYRTIEFRVDTRNGRSMRAVEKLGATKTGVLEKNLQTWTGYVRDTAIFSLSRADWETAA
ncbi:MAG: GNAT family N-acetyltransferase [Sphingomonas sp.]|nr:GNAT family N-acetyltransferase [Sphingomonas sp.]